jgi:glycosyltransferase involved in cell wall biosynthesis/putative methionine-R-sulfoxide reductase with GAF domain
MRVLMLVSEAPPIKSGIARVAGELTEGLLDRGFRIDTLSANEVRRLSIKEFRISSLGLVWPRIQKELDQYDIIHVHGSVPSFSDVGLLLGRIGGRLARRNSALVYTHHCDIDIEGLDLPVCLYNKMHRNLLRLADHVVASTPSYAMQLEGFVKPGRLSDVRFGVRAEEFHAPSKKPARFNVLFVGQLRPYKGVDVLLRAWSKVEGADLHIVGDGHERANLEALTQQLNLSRVTFHGSVSDERLRQFYSRAHAIVLPSTRKAEAFGLVLLEGMASGCVPIASDLPGVSDVVGSTGYTFQVGDSDALAKLLIDLRDDPDRRRKSELAVARAVGSDWQYTIESYAGIYKQVRLGRLLEVISGSQRRTPGALQVWLSQVASIVGADKASLMLMQPEERNLRIAASIGVEPDIVATTSQRMGAQIAGFAAKTGKPLRIHTRKMPLVARLFKNQPDLSSSLVLPIQQDGHTVGVLNLARGKARLAFTGIEEHWLHKLAIQIAPLIATYRQANYASVAEVPGGRARKVRYADPGTLFLPLRRAGLVADRPADLPHQPAVVVSEKPFTPLPVPALFSSATGKVIEFPGEAADAGREHIEDRVAGEAVAAGMVDMDNSLSIGQWAE